MGQGSPKSAQIFRSSQEEELRPECPAAFRAFLTRCSLAGDGGDTLTYQAISSSRLCALFITYAGRVALVVFLLIYGSLFLVYTIPLGDLLLNAVALEIVTTVDEVLFETLVPALAAAAAVRSRRCA